MGNISSQLVGGSGNGGTVNAPKPITTKSTCKGYCESQSLKYAVSGMQGMRNTMEDRHIQSDCIPIAMPLPVRSPSANAMDLNHSGIPSAIAAHSVALSALNDHSIYGVFDGHGGDFTSNFLEANFLSTFSKRPEVLKYATLPKTGSKSRSDVTGVQLLKQALEKTFAELDLILIPLQRERNQAILSGKIIPPCVPSATSVSSSSAVSPDNNDGQPLVYDDDDEIKVTSNSSSGERSGSTGVIVVLTPSHIICANTGDSRAVLRRDGNVLPLSFDHKPSDVPERKRIIEAGGTVKGKRVDGDLAVSRAFGDFAYKQDKVLPAHKQKVIVKPDITVYPRNYEKDEFMVIACDGIWDVASNKQCTDFVQKLLSEGEIDLGNICEEALDTCLDRNSRDNMTMMIVAFPGIHANSSSTAVVNNALWGHRMTRQKRDLSRATADATHKACLTFGQSCVLLEKRLWVK